MTKPRDAALRDTALIVIDVQEEYFSGRLPIGYPPSDDSLERIGAAMDHEFDGPAGTVAAWANKTNAVRPAGMSLS
mgnify:CR=1 FL=1